MNSHIIYFQLFIHISVNVFSNTSTFLLLDILINDHDKYFVIRNIRVHIQLSKCWRGTCWSVELRKGYMLIYWKAEGVRGKRKIGNPWCRMCNTKQEVRKNMYLSLAATTPERTSRTTTVQSTAETKGEQCLKNCSKLNLYCKLDKNDRHNLTLSLNTFTVAWFRQFSQKKTAVFSCLTNALAPPPIALKSCSVAQTDRPV